MVQRDRLILGIDPGLAATGYGLLGPRDEVLGCGSIRTGTGPTAPRLAEVVKQVEALVSRYAVTEAAIEELFMGRNRTSAMAVAHARGAIMACLERAGVCTYEYKPNQVKSLLTGYGMADKSQMARMLFAQVAAPAGAVMDTHAVDAIAVAVCHSRSRRLQAATS